MKRIKKIAVTLFLFIVLFSLTGCKNKDSITAQEFKSRMEKENFVLTDAKSQFSEYNYIQSVYVARDKDDEYQIEFYQMSDDTNAQNFFNTNKTIFEQNKSSSSSQTSKSVKNYSKYTLTSNGKYYVVSRINNTVIYASVDEEHKDDVKDILDELNY